MTYMAMTIDQLEVSPFNARKDRRKLSPESIEWMAASLVEHGQIMPLVVHPMRGRKGVWGVFAGQRRYLGFKKAIEDGRLPRDTVIDTMLRAEETEGALIALSIAENVSREDLFPYETYAALARSARKGMSLETIAATIGKDRDYVRRGVRLGMLAEPIFKAYAEEQLSLDCAKAFAATEDTKLQLQAYEAFRQLPRHEQVRRAVHQLLKVGDRELTRLLNFVGEERYRADGGRFELDLFADEEEYRGLVRDEGLLRQLAADKFEDLRARIRRRAGRDLRFAAEPPKNGFDMVDRSLLITPPPATLDPADEAALQALLEQQAELSDRARAFVDADGKPLPGTEGAIAEIDARYVPNEAAIAAIEDKRPLILPDGEIYATIELDDTGEAEIRYWWKDHREQAAAEKPASSKAAARASSAPVPRATAASPRPQPIDDKPIKEGSAIARGWSGGDWDARERADRRLKEAFGLTRDGIHAMRTLRRSLLRSQLIQDMNDGGTVARDYFVWGQLRMLLTTSGHASIGLRPIAARDIVEMREENIGEDLLGETTAGLYEETLETLQAAPCFTEPDLAKAFLAYRTLHEDEKQDAAAMLACITLERSLDADGYRVPLHDVVARETGVAGDRELREFHAFTPTAPFFNLFDKDSRLGLAIPFVGRNTIATWAKRRTAEQNELVAKVFLGTAPDPLDGVEDRAAEWVHPLLSFIRPEASAAPLLVKEAVE